VTKVIFAGVGALLLMRIRSNTFIPIIIMTTYLWLSRMFARVMTLSDIFERWSHYLGHIEPLYMLGIVITLRSLQVDRDSFGYYTFFFLAFKSTVIMCSVRLSAISNVHRVNSCRHRGGALSPTRITTQLSCNKTYYPPFNTDNPPPPN